MRKSRYVEEMEKGKRKTVEEKKSPAVREGRRFKKVLTNCVFMGNIYGGKRGKEGIRKTFLAGEN